MIIVFVVVILTYDYCICQYKSNQIVMLNIYGDINYDIYSLIII